ncbi:hypothetical protein BS50DRAFT_334621 [Corynespora cassiicola Philippines]|uniref:Uncharacterized protein n=1 Tax=Corynespora cassiicola Philippines TaxID=1448308 RepID=A0A2T2NV52_CORCC|nr:hypothetical protein BS50DRAFT_334621 [Corynespora cassiicola Philippines]
MTCNITSTPLHPEPLPLYSRHDPDAVSIHSAAPSYVSETPTYTSHRTPRSLLPPVSPNAQQTRGLPSPHFAPGFQSRANLSDFSAANFNVASWSSTRTSNNSRQYNAVARRRANQAANTTAILNSLSAVPPPTPSASTSPTASSSNVSTYPVQVGSSSEPVSPLEDPYLVGEDAARRARTARVYREMCLRETETNRHESRSWDFMYGQMADWEDRDKSWRGFRHRVGQTKLLGRRLGLRS